MSPRARRAVWQVRAFVSAGAITALVALSGQHTADVSMQAASTVGIGTAAQERPCVSRPEFRALHKGMTRERVTRLIGSRGEHVEGRHLPRRLRMYDTCGISAWVLIGYTRHGRVADFNRIGHD